MYFQAKKHFKKQPLPLSQTPSKHEKKNQKETFFNMEKDWNFHIL